MSELARTSRLSSGGNFLVTREGSQGKWDVYHIGSGTIMTHQAGYRSQDDALSFADELEQARDGLGHLVDWQAPHVGDRLGMADGRDGIETAIARGREYRSGAHDRGNGIESVPASSPETEQLQLKEGNEELQAAPGQRGGSVAEGDGVQVEPASGNHLEGVGRFSTVESMLSHWRLEEGDPFRIAETKDEASTRRVTVRRREERASEVELVGEALVVARMHYPDSGRYRWGVFHAGTAQPVLMLESGQDGVEARALAEALDQWRDATGDSFDWSSAGLVDRLRSPYGVGMLDQVRGRDPEARWAGSAPADAMFWETDDGQQYAYDSTLDKVTVYDPDGLLIARGERKFDPKTRKNAFLGEMRDGRRIAGQRSNDFVQNAVWQHRIAQLVPAARDELWIYYLDHRPIVHGTDRYADDWPDMKALLRSSGFTWSGYAKAYVTAGTTRAIARAQSVDRLARALYAQGRMVEIRADEDRLRGVLAPAAPAPAAARAAVPVPAAATEAPPVDATPEALVTLAPKTPPVLTPQDLTDEQLAAELERLNEERRGAAYGSPRHKRLDEQTAPLRQEHDRRQIAQLENRPDPAGMQDGEIAAEREALAAVLGRNAFQHQSRAPLVAARRERDELLRVEQARRTAAQLEARTPVAQMTDEDLQAEGTQLVKDRHQRPPEAADAFGDRVAAVGKEIADRRLQAWGEQPPAEGLDDVELAEALETLRGHRLSDTEFAGSYPAKEGVEKAFKARRQVLETEAKRRDEKAFRALLEADGRIRLTTYGHNTSTMRVRIDNRWYGELTDFYPGWRARLWRGRDITRDEPSRTDALRWLIGEYAKDPETRDTRTWGAYVAVKLPPSFVDQLTTHFGGLTLSEEAEKYLIAQVADSSRSQSWDETGKKIMVHAVDLPVQTLPVLERMGRGLVGQLDNELDSDDRKARDRAKRARPHVLRTIDELGALLEAHGLEPLASDNASTGTPQDGEADSERVRDDGPPALGDVPTAGAGRDGGPGDVLPEPGGGRATTDHGADRGQDGRGDAGDGPLAAGGQAESGPADGPGAGAEGDRVPGAGGEQPGQRAAPLVFRPASQDDLAPAGERAKASANLEAVRVLKRVREEQRAATAAEQQVLARWSGWGSVPEIFAVRPRQDDPVFGPGGEREGGYATAAARWESFADVRDPLRVLLDDDEWRAAAASTLSAHYTPPEITSALWQALADLGFDGGEVLEPGSGAGVTFGTAPESARLTGVEIDPTSAAISRLLAPGVTVLNESFADTVAPDGAFDAVLGNVPFGRVMLYDPRHNQGRHRLHNHFLVKSVALTRPGGVVALITSRHTLDGLLGAARQDLVGQADLLGAVRLPNKAFARSAGTDVVTDILILRRRMAGDEPLGMDWSAWVESHSREIDGHSLPVNDYFTAHPEHVLGTLTSRMGQHGPEVAVDGDPDVAAALRIALRQITDRALLARRGYVPHPEGPYRPHLRLKPAADLQDFTGRLSADVDGKLWQATKDSEQVAVELPADQHAQLTALIELKDLVRGLNELDRSGSDAALADAHRRLTKQTYERYVAAHGPLSRPRQQQHVTTQTDVGTSAAGLTAWGYFLNDPQAYEVLALEMWEADTETVRVSEILDHAPAARRSVLGQHTDDAQQALDAVVAERGHVDLPHIAWMLQVDEDEARRRLARSVFTDPLTGNLLYSADYLSGDVRTKLQIARQAARRDAAFKVNVAELERVQPREMLPGQFAIRLGAAWLPDDLVQQFFREYLGDAHLTVQHSGNGNWHILKGRGLSEENEVKHTAGGLHPLALLNRVLNGGSMAGRPSDDEEAARAVRVKAEEWRDTFEAWVLDDSARAARAADVYNRQMNNRVVRDFTGTRPSLTGLDPDFTPYDHQLAAAARMAHERCLVLSHVVGAGKTAAMAIGMMAMKNTGQIDKPMVAVPNYLVEQWEGEVRRLFPAARILTLTSADLADGKRDRMLQYVRANSFDMVIMSHSLFDSIPLSPEFYEFYNDEELRKLDAQILHERRRDGKSISLKQLQERRQQHEQDLKAKAAAGHTPGQVYLDDLGFDFFAIDEAHEYKNLAVRSKIPGARVAGSAKAQHLHAVLEWARRNKPTGPMGCLATGTPLSNAIGELHTLLLLANPDLLRDLGIEEFDAFATMYGKMVERLEMTVDGKGFKSVERFASFHSVNSLLRQLWLPVVDYKDEEDLGLPLPGIKGGEPELMLIPATAEQQALMQELGERYGAYHLGRVDKSEDNPLSINTDARVIALDPRLIDSEAEPGNKLRLLADRIAAKYHETKDNRYTYSTKDPRPHPVPGALQMVFLNQGTPGGKNRGNFNAYQELKDLLVARDVPADKIDFIHDASRADQRRKLTARANHGGSNVLIGSTQRMGKGLNAQNRAVALYHVDPDFRPADMKQKDGRALRQGNQNKLVEIVWTATENTFDSRMYGILATKAKGFDQLYKARLDAGSDEIQEVDEAIVPYEEAMAIISGNPYLIAQEELRKQVRTLTLDQNNRATQRAIVFEKVQQLDKDIDSLTWDIAQRGAALPSLRPVLGDDFQITLGGATYTKHKDAAVPLTDALAGVMQALIDNRATNRELTLGQLGGRDLVAMAYREDHGEPFVRVHLDGLPGSLRHFDTAELSILKGETLLRRLTKAITEAPERQIEDEGNLRAKRATREKLLAYGELLRGPVAGLSRVRERLSLVDSLVNAQITVNKAGEPSKDESAAETQKRKQAVNRRDELQRQLDRFDATSPQEAPPKAGEAPLDLDDPRPRNAENSPQQGESEAVILRAHVAVHGDPDGTAAARLAELGKPEALAPRAPGAKDATPPADGESTDATEGDVTESAGTWSALQELIDGFGDRVMIGYIGGPQPAPELSGQRAEQPVDQPIAPAEAAAQELEPAPTPPIADDLDNEETDTPGPDGDGYGTADLYDAFGLAQPERVPAPALQDEPEPETEGSAGVSDGQMTVEEVQPEAVPAGPDTAASRDDGRVRLTSADGRLTFTLVEVPADEGIHQGLVEGYQRRYSAFAAVVETKNEQAAQTPAEQAEQLAQWRRTHKGVNSLKPFRPLPSLRLTKQPDAPSLTPAEYGIGWWVTWRDTQSDRQVTGQVMAPGAAANTWYVSTDRTGHTGEYHVLHRSGKKSTGYTYSLDGAVTDLGPADGPGEQLPLEDLPQVDSVPARPVPSYADWLPTRSGLARAREPIPVTVGEIGPRFAPAEVAFDVVADGIRFVVKLGQDDETLTSTFVPRVESDGKIIVEFDALDNRAEAVDLCVGMAREAREKADKPLYAQNRNNDFAVADDGVCGKCSLHLDDNDEKELYQVNGGDPECIAHLFLRLRVPEADVVELALARRIWATRVAPEPPAADTVSPADAEQSVEAPAEQATEAATATQDPHEVEREALRGGDRITAVVNAYHLERSSPWDQEAPGQVHISGTVFPGYRDYKGSTTLLDAVILDMDSNELAASENVFVSLLPARVTLIPAEHRAELRPEPRTVAQIRVGDLIAEGGQQGEVVRELRFVQNTRRGSMMTFSTRDVASGSANTFTLAVTDEVAVVPRERRLAQDIASLFGRHGSHSQVASEVQRTYDLYAAVVDVTGYVWPNATGPQDELRALDAAIGAIDANGKGVDAYRANAVAMETAATAAAALFAATDDDHLNRDVGPHLHQLHQHLDVQAHRLHADVAHLAQRAQQRATATPPASNVSPQSASDEAAPRPSSEERPAQDEAADDGGRSEPQPREDDPAPTLLGPALEACTAAALADPHIAQAARANDLNNFVVAVAAWASEWLPAQWENVPPDEWPEWVRAYFRDDGEPDPNGLYAELAGSVYEQLRTPEPAAAPSQDSAVSETEREPEPSPNASDAGADGQLDLFGAATDDPASDGTEPSVQPAAPATNPPTSTADTDTPGSEPDGTAIGPEAAPNADDTVIVQTPDGPGTVIGTDDGDLVLVSTQSGPRVWESSDVQWPDDIARPENADRVAKERRNAADEAQASTAEGIELRYGNGNRLVDLDTEAGHGTVVDADDAVIGWVRARTGDDGRRYWWAQDSRGGAPDDMPFHEELPPAAGVPAIRAAESIRSELHFIKEPAYRSPLRAEYAAREVRLTTAQVRELRRLALDAAYPDGSPIEPPEWVTSHRKYVLNTAQMQALGSAAQAAADAVPGVTAEERRTARVLRNAAERFDFEVYDTARWRATIPPIGEADPYAGPYQPRPRPETPNAPQETADAPAPALEPAAAETQASAESEAEPAAPEDTTAPTPVGESEVAPTEPQVEDRTDTAPNTPAPDHALTAAAAPGLTDAAPEDTGADDTQLGLFPSETPETPAPVQATAPLAAPLAEIEETLTAAETIRSAIQRHSTTSALDHAREAWDRARAHYEAGRLTEGDSYLATARTHAILARFRESAHADFQPLKGAVRRFHDAVDEILCPGGAGWRPTVGDFVRARHRYVPESRGFWMTVTAIEADGIHVESGSTHDSKTVLQPTDLGPHADLPWQQQPFRAPGEPRASDQERRIHLSMAPQVESGTGLPEPEQLDVFSSVIPDPSTLSGPRVSQTEGADASDPDEPAPAAASRTRKQGGEPAPQTSPEGEDAPLHEGSAAPADIEQPAATTFAPAQTTEAREPVTIEDPDPPQWYTDAFGADLSPAAAAGVGTRDTEPQQPEAPTPRPGTAVAEPMEEPAMTTPATAVDEATQDRTEPAISQIRPGARRPADSYTFLPSNVGGPALERQLLYGNAVVATVQQSADRQWFARLTVTGLPPDVTPLALTASGAAEMAAVLHSTLTNTPYGEPPTAAPGYAQRPRADVLRTEFQDTARQHHAAVDGAASRIWPGNHHTRPQFEDLTARLGEMGRAWPDRHSSRRMAAQLNAVERTALAWRHALPANPADDERRLLAYPLAHILHDVRRLRERLRATVDVVTAERAAAQQAAGHAAPQAAVTPEPSGVTPSPPAPVVERAAPNSPTQTAGVTTSDLPTPTTGSRTRQQGREPAPGDGGAPSRESNAAPAETREPVAGSAPTQVPRTGRPVTIEDSNPPEQHSTDVRTDVASSTAEPRTDDTAPQPEAPAARPETGIPESPEAPAMTTPNTEPDQVIPAPALNAYMDDYRAGRPPRDEAAADAYREWRLRDDEDQEAALEARGLEDEYERYDGPLGWSDWLQQRDDREVGTRPQNSARSEPPAAGERGDALQARAMARASEEPSRAQQALPLWAGRDRPDGAWREAGGILYDSYGTPQWRLKKTPAAPSPPQTPVDSSHPATPDDTQVASEQDAQGQPRELSPRTSDAYEPVGIREAFEPVTQAWADIVPPEHGTRDDLRNDLDTPLRDLEEQLQPVMPTARPDNGQQDWPAPANRAESTPPQRDSEPVNAALRQTDAHHATLKDLPEWQKLQTLRGAATHLWNVLRERAGQYFERLRADTRVQGFFRTLSIRTAEGIATLAQAAADWLRRGRPGGDLPAAEALLKLNDAALAYSTPGIPRPNQPTPDVAADNTATKAPQLRTSGPVPYPTRKEATQASADIEDAFEKWFDSPMGQELADSDHPKVAAFRRDWGRLPLDMPDGPGPAAGPFSEVGQSAQALAERAKAMNAQRGKADRPPRFTEADIAALQTVASRAERHGARLSVTLPPQVIDRAARRAAAPQMAAPRPRVATPSSPAPKAGSANMSA